MLGHYQTLLEGAVADRARAAIGTAATDRDLRNGSYSWIATRPRRYADGRACTTSSRPRWLAHRTQWQWRPTAVCLRTRA